ncbi:MAG: hypothetical protein RBS80_01665 [Thermoguttaceae bacterium]|jgi:hypothetical protein|nr:hypothetical protein [Thermoguttaceae bacterium]
MCDRAKLQYCYELAFHPPRLNEVWRRLKAGEVSDVAALGEMLDAALLLHQALPSEGYASQRALTRLALYQAKARAFGTVRFLENLRRRLGRDPLEQTVVPGWMVRDIGLPPLCHHQQLFTGRKAR